MKEKNALITLTEIIQHASKSHPEIRDYLFEVLNNPLAAADPLMVEWAGRLYAAPAPPFVKRSVLQRNGFLSCTWIETGTYLGQTTEFLSKIGAQVISIEPEPLLHANACEKLKHLTNVRILKGLSEEVFPVLLPQLSGKINFWLDGHYSAGITHKGPLDTPILIELKAIGQNLKQFDAACVMIDDLRCFDGCIEGSPAYPTLRTLVDWAEENRLTWHIEHDIFVAKSN